ncbi:hypothetical protein KIN20_008203 [Parelaphostrongylus tenuis]|uniref:Uncharacterized protein n=1 Tax=Parelaphostrongylus tenuis TaxID=148309 RepID=A0AAD5QMJ5_PARTN|nr:hypothetical protein KIN20_008203 [Parelaphostrongylus tenuis]
MIEWREDEDDFSDEDCLHCYLFFLNPMNDRDNGAVWGTKTCVDVLLVETRASFRRDNAKPRTTKKTRAMLDELDGVEMYLIHPMVRTLLHLLTAFSDQCNTFRKVADT